MNDAREIVSAVTPPKSGDGASLQSTAEKAGSTIGHYRWVICGLLFFATTVNYVDRQVLGYCRRNSKTQSIGPRPTTATLWPPSMPLTPSDCWWREG